MIFLVIFVVVPLIELYFMIEIGDVFGALPTVMLVVLTAVVGGFMVRLQGFTTLMRMRESASRGEAPALEMVESVVLLFSGLMLLLPGFITDTLGFLLLIPALRQALIVQGLKRSRIMRPPPGAHDPEQHRRRSDAGRVIEADSWKKED